MDELFGDTVADEDANTAGRRHLREWRAAQPDNYFVDDRNFQRQIEMLLGAEKARPLAARLYHFGRVAATDVDPLVAEANKPENLPRLDRFSDIGERTENVAYHPAHHEAGRLIYASEVISVLGEPGQNLASLALFYLSAMNGEAGHNCPIACTAGLVKVLQHVAPAPLRQRFLPRVLDPNYDTLFHGAQYLTEVQGGSDVGANATSALPLDSQSDVWLLNGEKWFCSNVTAHLALVTARVPGQGDGTRGLGLFLLPRHLEDGRVNSFHIRRLKEKLGTRSMASAELDFRDAVAYLAGPAEHGFRNVMTHVVNTSRLYNAVGCCAHARRAYVVARTYARQRMAFDRPIIQYPLVQAGLTRMRADGAAMLAGTMRLVKMWDDIELGQAEEATQLAARLLVNLNKYRTAVLAHGVINEGIELLGGNGAIESFSVLPRLLRDNVVYENWEGPHNVLIAQAQRDMRRYQVHKPLLALVRQMFGASTVERLKREGLAELEAIGAEIEALLTLDELGASLFFRPLLDRLTDLYYSGCLLVEAAWETYHKRDHSKRRLAEMFFDQRVMGRGPKEISDYVDQVRRLCGEQRPTRMERLRDEDEDAEGTL